MFAEPERYEPADVAFEIAALARLEALWEARSRFDAMVREAVQEVCARGVHRGRVAEVLGVHRATLYRQFLTAELVEADEGGSS